MKNTRDHIIAIIAVLSFVLYFFVSGYGHINIVRLAMLEGDYRPTDEDLSWMILTIDPVGGAIMDNSLGGPYLATFDDEAGNPGVEGKIVSLDKDTIVIKIDDGYYERLPDPDWKTTDSDSRLEMHYEKSRDKLILENNGKKMEFYSIGK
ncbi:MAG: hypothetical protein IJJ31_08605 [Mogibacterium sp.]|nr:hypothetical protein [Mogibacterium sp.]